MCIALPGGGHPLHKFAGQRRGVITAMTVNLNGDTVRLPLDVLDTLSQASADAVTGVNASGLMDAWNPAAKRLFGLGAEQVAGSPPRAGATEYLKKPVKRQSL